MKSTFFALAIAAVFVPAPSVAAPGTAPMSMQQALALTQATYPGEVLAIRYDQSRREHPHYHVDMRFANGAIAYFQLDAVTGRFANVPAANEPPPARMSLASAVHRVNRMIPGRVTSAELDATDLADPHYHVDLVLAGGKFTSLRVDPNGDLHLREGLAPAARSR
jgi:uncharacterized membrane protein YkoI